MFLRNWFNTNKIKPSQNMVVLITGCDTGLGFSMACEAASAGYTVVAGLLRGVTSKEAMKLKEECGQKESSLHLLEMDVTKEDSVKEAALFVENIVEKNNNYYLHSVVNNAGIMIFGDTEWLTSKQISQHLNVNLLGPMLVYKYTAHLLRKSATIGYRPRLVLVSSHCSLQPLPTLAVYGATKCGLAGWEEALRMELDHYNVNVVKFIPGSLVLSTKILENQNANFELMRQNMTVEQKQFYGSYFDRFVNYISMVTNVALKGELKDKVLMKKFRSSLEDETPSLVYKHEPLWYGFYHFLFKILPYQLRKRAINAFIRTNRYR